MVKRLRKKGIRICFCCFVFNAFALHAFVLMFFCTTFYDPRVNLLQNKCTLKMSELH